jgi:hypothetical protein
MAGSVENDPLPTSGTSRIAMQQIRWLHGTFVHTWRYALQLQVPRMPNGAIS